MQHMQMEALSMNPLCTSCTSACSRRPCCYSCIDNSDGHQSISLYVSQWFISSWVWEVLLVFFLKQLFKIHIIYLYVHFFPDIFKENFLSLPAVPKYCTQMEIEHWLQSKCLLHTKKFSLTFILILVTNLQSSFLGMMCHKISFLHVQGSLFKPLEWRCPPLPWWGGGVWRDLLSAL